MKIYKQDNVMTAALKRINYLFDEFEEVIVGFSGGKDSTVCLNLTLQVAEERGRLPVKVCFVDQEAEWQTVIDYVERVMTDPRVTPLWFQMPIKIFNSTSTIESWLMCWEEGAKWMRDRWPGSITKNVYGTDRFAELFTKILEVDFKDKKTCYIAGVRCEESPTRFMGLTSFATYKAITWGKALNKKLQHFTFYPLYDWSYTDIWKAIHDNHWDYCKIYDYMYQHGVKVQNMRVSNVHHETAVQSLFYLQEIEQDTWNKLTKRIAGISTAGHMPGESFFVPKELPYMFTDWKEYRDYLTENILTDPLVREKFRAKFIEMDEKYADIGSSTDMYKNQINSLLTNDFHFTKLGNWERRPEVNSWRKWKRGIDHPLNRTNKYIPK